MVWVNLLPWRQKIIQQRWHIWRLVWTGIVLMAAVGISNGFWLRAINQRSAAAQRLWAVALRDMGDVRSQRVAMRDRVNDLQEQLAASQRHRQRLAQWIAFSHLLGETFPADAWLEKLEKSRLKLEMLGLGGNIDALHLLAERLDQSTLFSRVGLRDMQRADAGTIKFTLHALMADTEDSRSRRNE